MENLLNNPWFIGIGGGILSGLVVALISRTIFSRRDNREYAQKVSQANSEVLYAIRPGISEGIIPTNGVVKKLIFATAQKYGVDESSMHDLGAISSELIKEVMDSSFISASAKKEFCEKLVSIREEAIVKELPEVEAEYEKSSRYRRQMVAMLSLMVGMLTAISGFMITIKEDSISDSNKILFLIVPAVVAVFVSIMIVLLKEFEKMKIKSMAFRFGGFRAELKPKEDNSKESKDT